MSIHGLMAQIVNSDFYSFRLGNMFNVNPAYCTYDDGINVIVNAQTLGSGILYSNKNMMAGIYSRIAKKSGLGLKAISDSRGAFQTFKSDVSYGFQTTFSEQHFLRFGVSAGIYNSSINTGRIQNYELLDNTDPTLNSNNMNYTQFMTGMGVVYTYKGLDVSASLPQVVSTTQALNSYLHSAVFYKIKANDKISIQPWISYQNMAVTKNLTGIFTKVSYKDLIWTQLGYQSNKSFMGALGVSFENIGISYGFRLSNPDLKQVSGAMHEMAISFKFGKKSSPQESDLGKVIKRLNDLLAQDVSDANRKKLQDELSRIKEDLRKAEIDNSNPEKAKEVEQQLLQIEDKIKQIEERLK
jgi:type IX secretion system PorP/SprF family membrane protein